MSEKLLKLLLSELETVRIKCKNARCGGVVETSVRDLDRHFGGWCCPLCKERFRPSDGDARNYLTDLQTALQGLKAAKDFLEVEFLLTAKD